MNELTKFNLQLFSDEERTEQADNTEQTQEEAITFANQSELDSFLDKRLSKALATRDKNWESKVGELVSKAQEEAAKKAEMTAQEKMQYEIEQREKKLAEREKGILKAERKAKALDKFSELNLPRELIVSVNLDDDDKLDKSIETVAQAFNEALEQKVNERLKQSASSPKSEVAQGFVNPFSKEHFNLTEQGKLWKENPELAKQLQNQAK